MSGNRYHCQPWTVETQRIAKELMSQIRQVAPELEVLFMGAAALGLPGKNDIDLDILCPTKDLTQYTTHLATVLGQPSKADEQMIIWEFEYKGFPIDAILSDPVTSHVSRQQAIFEKLQQSEKLRKQYEDLKLSCDGLADEDYEKQKRLFFALIAF